MIKTTGTIRPRLALALLLALAATAIAVAGEQTTDDVALGGYCPVAYAEMGKAVEGNQKFASEYDGKTYHLANQKAKKMFDKSPESYAVAYDGWCATGIAHGMKVESDPKVFEVRDGKTYLFSTEEARAMFTNDRAEVVARADNNWPTVANQGH